MHTDNGDTARFEFPWSSTVFRLKWKLRDFDKILAFPFVLWWSVEVIKLLCECDEVCVVFARCYRLAAWVLSRCHAVSVLCRYSLSKMLSSFSEWICVPGPTNQVICPAACTFLQEERCGLICLFLDALMLCSLGCGWWLVLIYYERTVLLTGW